MGRVTRRLGGAVEPWSYESAFADLGRTLTFPPEAVQSLNRRTEYCHVRSIRKRAWLALPDSTALFDVDLGLQIDPVGSGGVAYPRGGTFDLSGVVDLIASGAALPIHLRSDAADRTHPMVRLGKPLAGHYALRTSPRRDGDCLVGSGRMTVVVEAPGLVPEIPESLRTVQLKDSRIQLASFNTLVPGGGDLRVHVLWDDRGTKGDRKRIRELRIHILRLHSIFELMRFLASPAVLRSRLSLADTKSDPGFDRLQRTLLGCVRIVQGRNATGSASPSSVLDAAFFSSSFVDRDLQIMLSRMLGAMRPKIRREIELFIEEEQRRADANLAAERVRNRLEATTIVIKGDMVTGNKYEINGSVVGPVGDNATVKGNIIGGSAHVEGAVIAASARTITIGAQSFPSGVLVAELRALREHIAESGDGAGFEGAEHLALAEKEAERGDSKGVLAALKKTGAWAVGIASQIGVPVAQAALEAALGV